MDTFSIRIVYEDGTEHTIHWNRNAPYLALYICTELRPACVYAPAGRIVGVTDDRVDIFTSPNEAKKHAEPITRLFDDQGQRLS